MSDSDTKPKKIVYLDMDGVLVDFKSGPRTKGVTAQDDRKSPFHKTAFSCRKDLSMGDYRSRMAALA